MDSFEEFTADLREVKARGYVETHRNADTGVGKTLEDLLGITENNTGHLPALRAGYHAAYL